MSSVKSQQIVNEFDLSLLIRLNLKWGKIKTIILTVLNIVKKRVI